MRFLTVFCVFCFLLKVPVHVSYPDSVVCCDTEELLIFLDFFFSSRGKKRVIVLAFSIIKKQKQTEDAIKKDFKECT